MGLSVFLIDSRDYDGGFFYFFTISCLFLMEELMGETERASRKEIYVEKETSS